MRAIFRMQPPSPFTKRARWQASLLLDAGADPKLADKDGRLSVQYALSRHYLHTALKFREDRMPLCI